MTSIPLSKIPSDWVAITDYESAAQQTLPASTWAYLQGGCARTPPNLDQQAFGRYRLLPRRLLDLQKGHTSIQLLDQQFEHPFILAPVAYQQLFHSAGEQATALAAHVTRTPMIISTLASTPLKTITQQTSTACWFQLYWQRSREQSLALVRQAEATGHQTIVLTIDAPHMGVRDRERRAGFSLPPQISAVNLLKLAQTPTLQPHEHPLFDGLLGLAPTWADVAWLVQQTQLPIILKGILHPDDARQAITIGVKGLIVSTHGGRVLEDCIDGLTMLPHIRDAVPVGTLILYDGGIRCGADAFKALALGANAILIGRPYIYGLALAGALGVAHVIKLLREELEVTMALCGTATIEQITPQHLYACRANLAPLTL
ncbi:MAG: alpha-hydroxy acid oxidase [Pseudomonadota bacterium]|nr:alpha-hydroxy acid oxidase [Pseudomonadota bacterium]